MGRMVIDSATLIHRYRFLCGYYYIICGFMSLYEAAELPPITHQNMMMAQP
ncbi:MAG: hypothetical protein WC351_05955 [Candidatus Izemoplasmatales bacterium]